MCRVRSQHEQRLRYTRTGFVPPAHVQIGMVSVWHRWGGAGGGSLGRQAYIKEGKQTSRDPCDAYRNGPD